MALADNLIAAWELDEASGNAIDSHGSNDLTDTNTVGAGTGLVYGSARDFESGSSEYFALADNADLSTGDIDYTFEVWLKLESSITCTVLAKREGYEYGIRNVPGSGGIRFTHGTNEINTLFDTLGALSTGTWYQVFAWHDATNNLNGITVNNGTPITSSDAGAAAADGGGAFNLGRDPVFGEPFDGLIGPVRFWKRVVTSDERTELYNAGAGRDYAYITGGGGDVTENATPVVATASVVTRVTTLTQAGTAVVTTSSVVGPAVTLTQAGTAVVATSAVVAPATSLGYAATAFGTVVTIPAPSVSGSTTTENATPVVATSSVVGPAPTLTQSPPAVPVPGPTFGAGVGEPVVTLTVAAAPVTVAVTVPAVTVSQDTVTSPTPVTSLVTVPAHLTTLSYASGAVAVTITVPSVTAGSPEVGPGGMCVAGSVFVPGAAAGSVFAGGVAAGSAYQGVAAGRVL